MRRTSFVLLLALAACKKPAAPECAPKLLVAHRGTAHIDGALDEPVWHAAAATEPFVDDGPRRVVPHTEARAAWDDGALYLVLYAADAELTHTDQVEVSFEGAGTVAAGPDEKIRCRFGATADCAAAGVVAKVERDGDVDANAEEDEEWVLELSLPWKLLGGRRAQLPIAFSRNETLDGKAIREVWSRTCGALRVE